LAAARPGAAGDGPFRTIGKARDAVRAVRQTEGGGPKSPVTVYLRGGTYFLPEPFVLKAEDGGTDRVPVTYAAFGDEKPVLSAGKAVGGWAMREVGGKQLWVAKVRAASDAGHTPRSLWVNGERRTRARHPNKGFLKVAEVPDATPQTDWTQGQTNFRYAPGDLQASPGAAGGAEVLLFSRWVEARLPVTRIDEADRRVHFGKKSVWVIQPEDRYFAEGAVEFLDEPGEWHFDAKAGELLYLPLPGEDPATVRAIYPSLTHVMRLEGDPAGGRSLRNVTFRGVAFAHSGWSFESPGADPAKSGFTQAASGVPAAVQGVGVRGCTFERCSISHVGGYALDLGRGCQNNRVLRCEITDLGAGGVKIGERAIHDNPAEQSFGNEVSDCRITDGGRVFMSAVGVWIGQSFDNKITHNEIADHYYTAISAGWTWGYGPSLCRGNVIEHNHVHHIGRPGREPEPVLSDMGGVYTLGIQPGTVIRFNRFHDIAGLKYGGWGIYYDEGSSGIVSENNLIYRTTHAGFHQHYGKDNVFRNNVIAFGKARQVERSRGEAHRSFTFERNIVYWSEGEAVTGAWDNYNVAFDHNCYWRVGGGEFQLGNLALSQWREKGLDVHSLVADPKFVSPEKDDFTLRADSPVIRLGFVPFDVSGAGPRKSQK
jgi:hypothetical protein